MVRGYYHQITTALKEAGFAFKRSGKGDHEIWWHKGTGKSVTVDRNSLSRHLANTIMKQAEIDRRF